MIDLRGTVKAKEQESYDDLPKGKYYVSVEKIEDWEEKTQKNAYVITRDEEGLPIKDEKGKILKELVPSLSYFTAKVTLRITEGEFTGRKIYTSLTTHPDAIFITEGFLFAVEENELALIDVQEKCINKELMVDLDYRTYEKKVQDSATGLESVEKRTIPNVKKFLRLSF